jgi:hypothetical protein
MSGMGARPRYFSHQARETFEWLAPRIGPEAAVWFVIASDDLLLSKIGITVFGLLYVSLPIRRSRLIGSEAIGHTLKGSPGVAEAERSYRQWCINHALVAYPFRGVVTGLSLDDAWTAAKRARRYRRSINSRPPTTPPVVPGYRYQSAPGWPLPRLASCHRSIGSRIQPGRPPRTAGSSGRSTNPGDTRTTITRR